MTKAKNYKIYDYYLPQNDNILLYNDLFEECVLKEDNLAYTKPTDVGVCLHCSLCYPIRSTILNAHTCDSEFLSSKKHQF